MSSRGTPSDLPVTTRPYSEIPQVAEAPIGMTLRHPARSGALLAPQLHALRHGRQAGAVITGLVREAELHRLTRNGRRGEPNRDQDRPVVHADRLVGEREALLLARRVVDTRDVRSTRHG